MERLVNTFIIALSAFIILASAAITAETIRSASYPSICRANPQVCSTGYNPLKKPHTAVHRI